MVDLAPLPVVRSPREHLSSNQIALLRDLVEHGAATKVRGGWMLAGHYRRAATLKPLEAKNLAGQTFRYGKHRLEANHIGRAVINVLDEAKPHASAASLPH